MVAEQEGGGGGGGGGKIIRNVALNAIFLGIYFVLGHEGGGGGGGGM